MFAAALSSLLTFPAIALVPHPGTDASWQAGLVMARQQGLRFGRDVVFTYGPLGFLTHPVLWGTASLAAIALTLVVVCGQTLLGTWWLRHVAPLPVAAAAAGLLSSLAWRYEDSVATPVAYVLVGVTLHVLLSPRGESAARAENLRCAGTGFAAGLLVLTKTDLGVLVVVCTAFLAFSARGMAGRVRMLAAAVGSFAAALVGGWVAAGQRLGELPDWLIDSANVASGFNEAMVYRNPPFSPWIAFAAAGCLAIAVVTAVRREGIRGADLAKVIAFVIAVVWLGAKSGFVRYDGHAYRYIWLVLVLGLATVPAKPADSARANWRGIVGVIGTVTVLAFVGVPGGAGSLFAFWRGPGHLAATVRPLVDESQRRRITATGTRTILAEANLPPGYVTALRGRRVHVESEDIATMWALGRAVVWTPNPIFQSYSAYTPRLDQRNADRYADDVRGPEVVLYQSSSGDGHHPRFLSPAAITLLLCHFRGEPGSDPKWQLLTRVPSQCGVEEHTSVVVGQVGQPLRRTPTADDNASIVVGRFELDRPLIERASALLRVRPRTWTFSLGAMDNDAVYRFDPATADQPHVLAVPTCLRNQLQRIDTRTYDSLTLNLSDAPPKIGVRLRLSRIAFRCPSG